MSWTINFNKDAVEANLVGLNKKAIAIVSNEALKDANYYCRQDTGELIRSSIRASDPDKGLLVWDTPYARKMYYVGVPHTSTNPNAELMWAHKSAKSHYRKYKSMVQKIIDGGV